MKQLKFKALTGAGEMLTREQMKNVLGGDNDYSTESDCSAKCGNSTVSITNCNGTCSCTDNQGCTCTGSTAVLTKPCGKKTQP